jgi:hypothetical protein
MFKTGAGRILWRERHRKTNGRRRKTPRISRMKNGRSRRIRRKRMMMSRK